MRKRLGSVVLTTAALLVGDPCAGAAEKIVSVRDVDFLNRAYAETMCTEEGKTITVKAGVYERTEEDDRAYFRVLEVIYGDLTGDGAEEAVVVTICNTGGTGQFSDGFVYTVRSGALVLLATLGVGDRADGGIHDVAIDGGTLTVHRYGTGPEGGACCPQVVESSRFRWNGKELVESGRSEMRTYFAAGNVDTAPPHRVRFLRNTSGAVLAGLSTGGDSYLVGARKNQTLVLRLDTEDATAEVAVLAPGGERLGSVTGTGQATLVLPTSGEYTLKVTSRAPQDVAEVSYSLGLDIR